jgi:hypothetical protein
VNRQLGENQMTLDSTFADGVELNKFSEAVNKLEAAFEAAVTSRPSGSNMSLIEILAAGQPSCLSLSVSYEPNCEQFRQLIDQSCYSDQIEAVTSYTVKFCWKNGGFVRC